MLFVFFKLQTNCADIFPESAMFSNDKYMWL